MMARYFIFRKLGIVFAALLALIWLSGCSSNSVNSGSSGGMSKLTEDEVETFDEAMAEIQNEDYEEGIQLLKELTARTRKTPIPYINLALAYKKMEEFESAESNLRTALDIEPDNPIANNEYGLLLRRVGRFSEARTVYEKILNKYPNFAMANKNLGVLCDIYIRDYACALKAYKAYSASMPGDEKVQVWISDLEWRIKQ